MSKTTLKQNNNIDYANISLVTILGDSMELVEGRQPIAGGGAHPIALTLYTCTQKHRTTGHAARPCGALLFQDLMPCLTGR